jgi:hypothetical protein
LRAQRARLPFNNLAENDNLVAGFGKKVAPGKKKVAPGD